MNGPQQPQGQLPRDAADGAAPHAPRASAGRHEARPPRRGALRYLPALALLLCGGWLASKAVPPRDPVDGFNLHAFGQLPVVYQGRVKPYDTLARNSLTIISDRQTFRDAGGVERPAIAWLLDVMSGAPRAEQHPVFRIHNHQVLETLGLTPRSGYRYALAELAPKLAELDSHVQQAQRLEPAQRDAYDVKALELSNKIMLHRILAASQQLPHLGHDAETARRSIELAAQWARELEQFPLPHVIPPLHEGEQWRPFLRALLETATARQDNPAVMGLARIMSSWAAGDAAAFNSEVARLQTVLANHPLPEDPALGFEAFFNHFAPFYHCAALYVIAFVIGCLAWLSSGRTLNHVAFWLLALTFLVHTWALGARVYISGYPPITNLYGTAVFIGWGCVLLGLIIEGIYALGIGNLIASVAGFLTLLVAHFLAGDGDTLEMMQAVLDTKFWLATHVIVINFGYSAMFLAGGAAILYVLRGVLTRSLDVHAERALGRIMYGTMCFALLLSFLGTVLGGLWADDSWGRFWGWDPKENGALMIVLWAALILHARWGGLVRTRGIAVLAILGNVVTAWSWFGVNQLGVGLHSYGFTDSVTFWLALFVISQLALAGLGMLPRRLWRSAPISRRTLATAASPATSTTAATNTTAATPA